LVFDIAVKYIHLGKDGAIINAHVSISFFLLS